MANGNDTAAEVATRVVIHIGGQAVAIELVPASHTPDTAEAVRLPLPKPIRALKPLRSLRRVPR